MQASNSFLWASEMLFQALPILSSPISVLIVVVLACVLDLAFGEPRRAHPIVYLGLLISRIEKAFYPVWDGSVEGYSSGKHVSKKRLFISGTLASASVLALVMAVIFIPLVVLASILSEGVYQAVLWFMSAWLVYLSIAQRSLEEHGRSVFTALENGQLEQARTALSMMVSRDTANMSKTDVSKATIETVLENENDAVIAPLVWFAVFGLPGVVIMRVVNTLDARWGYRSNRYEWFGKFAARADDVMSYVPARLCACLMLRFNHVRLKQALDQAVTSLSPNAGLVMSAGALALNVQIGGTAVYSGREVSKPELGRGEFATQEHLKQALRFIRQVQYRMLMFCTLLAGSIAALHFYIK